MISPTHGVTRLPNITYLEDPDDATSIGFSATAFIADTAQTLLVGDYVYASAVGDKVSKSATVANYTDHRVGIVVGGDSLLGGNTPDDVCYDSTLVGKTAATAGQRVWVAFAGKVYGIANAQIAAIGSLIAGATAGRVATGTTAGGVVGINIGTAAAAGDPIKIFLTLR